MQLRSSLLIIFVTASLLSQYSSSHAEELIEVSEKSFLIRDIAAIDATGALAIIDQYELFSANEKPVVLYANDQPNDVWKANWHSDIDIAFEGGPGAWQLFTNGDFQACIFKVTSSWYELANESSEQDLMALVQSELLARNTETNRLATGETMTSWTDGKVHIGVICEADIMKATHVIPFKIQISRLP
ncbi:hypothetical protein IT575_15590 [bacterium]|nr:hypothetical protein [bacterium]